MHDLPSQCKLEGSPGHGQTGEGNFGEGLVRLSVNRVLVFSMSASHVVGCRYAPRPGHTKDHHKNGTNCLPSWHTMR